MHHARDFAIDEQESRMPMAEFVIRPPVQRPHNRPRPRTEELSEQLIAGHLRETEKALGMLTVGISRNERHVKSPDCYLLSAPGYNP